MRLLRDAFSPYEIARGALLVSWFCVASGLVMAFVFNRPIGLTVLFLTGVAAALVAWYGARCAGCGKSPMRWYLTDWGERRRGEPMGNRIWPERTCSSCGTRLDTP